MDARSAGNLDRSEIINIFYKILRNVTMNHPMR